MQIRVAQSSALKKIPTIAGWCIKANLPTLALYANVLS